jgi:hypothetical protein
MSGSREQNAAIPIGAGWRGAPPKRWIVVMVIVLAIICVEEVI